MVSLHPCRTHCSASERMVSMQLCPVCMRVPRHAFASSPPCIDVMCICRYFAVLTMTTCITFHLLRPTQVASAWVRHLQALLGHWQVHVMVPLPPCTGPTATPPPPFCHLPELPVCLQHLPTPCPRVCWLVRETRVFMLISLPSPTTFSSRQAREVLVCALFFLRWLSY